MSSHPWCSNTARDEAIRLAEDDAAIWRRLEVGEVIEDGDEFLSAMDGQWRRTAATGTPAVGSIAYRRRRVPLPDHRDLPQAVAELRERVARLEDHFADASKMVTPPQPSPVPPAPASRPAETKPTQAKRVGKGWWFDKSSAPPPPPPPPPPPVYWSNVREGAPPHPDPVQITEGDTLSRAGKNEPSNAQNDPKCTERDNGLRTEQDETVGSQLVKRLERFTAGLLSGEIEMPKGPPPGLKSQPQPADGLRTERVTLEFQVKGSPPNQWPWSYIISRSDAIKMRPGESVRVVEETHFDDLAQVAMERNAAREECDRLRAILPPESERGQGVGEGSWAVFACKAVAERDEARALHVKWVELATQARIERERLKARVAELEAAPAANAGGEGNHQGSLDSSQPQPPRGWLTSEERRTLENFVTGLRTAAMAPFHDEAVRSSLTKQANDVEALLARSTPPKVRRPMPWHFHTDEAEDEGNQAARDRQWEDAIREAGGEVE